MIQAVIDRLVVAWSHQTPRDQRALRWGFGAATLLAVLALVVARVDSHQQQRARIADKSQQLIALQQGLVVGSGTSSQPRDAAGWASALAQALGANALPVEVSALPGEAWQANLSEVRLEQIIALERQLARRGMTIARYRLDAGVTPGTVSAQLEWRRRLP